jgi:hypothetical protein
MEIPSYQPSVRHDVVRKAALWTNTNLHAKNAAN